MKLIIIRGIPGTGKTKISEILGKIIVDSEIIRGDNFKIQAMKNKKTFAESLEISYKKILFKLESLYKNKRKIVIVEEVLCSKEFYDKLHNFIVKTKSEALWFRLTRPIGKLLEVESKRKRKIKNSEEDLIKLSRELDLIKIEGEVIIKNDNLIFSVKNILENL